MYHMYYTGNKSSSQFTYTYLLRLLLQVIYPPQIGRIYSAASAHHAEKPQGHSWGRRFVYLWKPGFWGKIQECISFLDITAKGCINSTVHWSFAPHTVSSEELQVDIALPGQIIQSAKFIVYKSKPMIQQKSLLLPRIPWILFWLISEYLLSLIAKWKMHRENRLCTKSGLGVPSFTLLTKKVT